MDISVFDYDTEAFEDGLWVSGIPNFGDMELCVRGRLSDKAMAVRANLERDVPKGGRDAKGFLTPEAAFELDYHVILDACLLDWRNLSDNGEPVPYSHEVAARFLTNKNFRLNAVSFAMKKVDGLMEGKKEAVTKN